jgi:hypothetical protein
MGPTNYRRVGEQDMAVKLALAGTTVLSLRVDYTLAVHLSGECGLQAEATIIWRRGEDERTLEATIEHADTNRALLTDLIGDEVVDSRVSERGELTVSFRRGGTLTHPPSDEYESWNVWGPGSRHVVCLPRGELAVWD